MMNDFNSLKEDEAALSLLLGDSFYYVKEKASYASFDYEGENNKYVLMLIEDPAHQYLPPAQAALFDKLLSAVKLEVRDIALVNLSSCPGAQFSDLKKFFMCNKLIIWGADPLQLGIPVEKYKSFHIDGVSVLYSDGLDILAKQAEAKKQLWTALQNMFKL